MPGWEPERLKNLTQLFEAYKNVTEEDLWNNLKYFLEQIIPVAEINDIKMAVHPDDPPWSIFGLPRIVKDRNDLARLLKLVDNPYNCLTLCSGAIGSNPNNDVPAMIREFGNSGKSAIFISSEFEELARICDRVLIMKKGSVIDEYIKDEKTEITEERLVHAAQ